MKRVWFAVILLAILIAGCVTVSVTTRRYAKNAMIVAQKAEQAAREENLSAARNLCRCGEKYWQKHDTFFSFFLRHDMTEGVRTAFARLGAYAETGDIDEFLAQCKDLTLQLEHIRDMELPTPKNIF